MAQDAPKKADKPVLHLYLHHVDDAENPFNLHVGLLWVC